jgi:hypothetical protein
MQLRRYRIADSHKTFSIDTSYTICSEGNSCKTEPIPPSRSHPSSFPNLFALPEKSQQDTNLSTPTNGPSDLNQVTGRVSGMNDLLRSTSSFDTEEIQLPDTKPHGRMKPNIEAYHIDSPSTIESHFRTFLFSFKE